MPSMLTSLVTRCGHASASCSIRPPPLEWPTIGSAPGGDAVDHRQRVANVGVPAVAGGVLGIAVAALIEAPRRASRRRRGAARTCRRCRRSPCRRARAATGRRSRRPTRTRRSTAPLLSTLPEAVRSPRARKGSCVVSSHASNVVGRLANVLRRYGGIHRLRRTRPHRRHERSRTQRRSIRIASRCIREYGDRTYAELNANVNRLVRVLRDAGVQYGERVALLCRNRAEFVEVVAASSQRGGFWLTAVNWHLTPDEVNYVVEDCGAKALFIDASIPCAPRALPRSRPPRCS